ncbi:hypothetical protein EI420_10510 [Vreelandella venusta]|uniref:hypothetical protein n=1 Tax=Vreelandella venusta TaxID=44935 RepID=UPI000F6EEF8B|nr:hypothetical protein [Halomonas venusta]AZM96088.1 hypothetical protein EI420_10510 [Halomonas venusta]
MLATFSIGHYSLTPCCFSFVRYGYTLEVRLTVLKSANFSFHKFFLNKAPNTSHFIVRREVNRPKTGSFICANEIFAFGVPHMPEQAEIYVIQLHSDTPQNLTIDPLAKLLGRNCSLIKPVANQPCGQLFQAFFFHSFQCFSKGGFFLFRDSVAFGDFGVNQVSDCVGVELDGHCAKNGRKAAVVFKKIDAFDCDFTTYGGISFLPSIFRNRAINPANGGKDPKE